MMKSDAKHRLTCCAKVRASLHGMGFSHSKGCPTLKIKDRRELPPHLREPHAAQSEDIGQGEGCEGGKCEARNV